MPKTHRIAAIILLTLTVACASAISRRPAADTKNFTYGVLAHDRKNPFGRVKAPADGDLKIYGSYASGCVAGAKAMEARGPGFQLVHLERNRMYGHPLLINLLTEAAKTYMSGGLMIIGDLGQPRGGPMTSGHTSHQIGLDADVWFSTQPGTLRSLVKDDLISIDESLWNDRYADQVLWFAARSEVSRIFVNAVIKKRLCAKYPGDERLKKMRPWTGHDDHFHIRLNCPEDQAQCVPQTPPDAIECDAKLDWWLSPESLDRIRHPQPSEVKPVMLP